MDKKDFIQALAKVRETSTKRKFTQSFDLVVALKGVNMKDPTQQLDLFVPLHFSKGKPVKICALVGPELATQAKSTCDITVVSDEFAKYAQDKKATKKLAEQCDYFLGQANIMPDIAKTFGRVLGTRAKMPNPKAGCIVPPNANLQPVYDRLQKTARVLARQQPMVQCMVGAEDMKDEEILDNIMVLYKQIVSHLPNEENNVRTVYLKLSMSKSVKVGAKQEEQPEEVPKDKPKAEEKPKEEPAEEPKKAEEPEKEAAEGAEA